jgi:hypothetical protein
MSVFVTLLGSSKRDRRLWEYVWSYIYAAWAFFMFDNSMQYLLLNVIMFILNNMYMTQKSMLCISTVIVFCSLNILKAIFNKQNSPSAFISMVSHFL